MKSAVEEVKEDTQVFPLKDYQGLHDIRVVSEELALRHAEELDRLRAASAVLKDWLEYLVISAAGDKAEAAKALLAAANQEIR